MVHYGAKLDLVRHRPKPKLETSCVFLKSVLF